MIANLNTKIAWIKLFTNKLGRLAQGIGEWEERTNTILSIPKHKEPKEKTVTYTRVVVTGKKNRSYLTVGNDKVNYPEKVITSTASLVTCKIVINTKNSCYVFIDGKNTFARQ